MSIPNALSVSSSHNIFVVSPFNGIALSGAESLSTKPVSVEYEDISAIFAYSFKLIVDPSPSTLNLKYTIFLEPSCNPISAELKSNSSFLYSLPSIVILDAPFSPVLIIFSLLLLSLIYALSKIYSTS